ncbi:MAG: DNA polymerase III subunit gamma/tau [Candidatus Goldbacteria bacterium]|nr:DNA polymerase III subunit gamma/tau [Candidatus Goldiibacteriota bacterium]
MENKYLVFARKWRPQSFNEIIGQDQVVIPLKRAIETGRIMHAYLFSGPRGIGKTTTARVFAKALNCDRGPTVNPCNECVVCKEINDGNSLDVIEIDGASNRGIDEIRQLRENIWVGSTRGKYKIYIIDEVHMLTKEAFNALLKTLEEPPRHVIFIFATTDPKNIPQTILSRCQHFRFRRMPVNLIIENLKMIAKNEKIIYEDEALYVIAKAADGALRDGQRIFDQIVTFAKGEKLTVSMVNEMLGEIEKEKLFELFEMIIKGDFKNAIVVVERVFERGYDLGNFLKNFIKLLKDCLLIKTTETKDFISITDEEYNKLKENLKNLSKEEILNILKKAIDTELIIEKSLQPDIIFEIFVIDSIMSIYGKAEDKSLLSENMKISDKQEKKPEKISNVIIESIEEKETVKELTKEIIQKRWENIIDRIKSKTQSSDIIQAAETSAVISFSNPNLFIIGKNPFYTNILNKYAELLKETIKEEFGKDVVLIIQEKEEYQKNLFLEKNIEEEELMNNPLIKEIKKVLPIKEIKIKKNPK